jgi:hypothetical protein
MEEEDSELNKAYLSEQLEAASEHAHNIFEATANFIKEENQDVNFNQYDAKEYMQTPVLKKLQWLIDKDLFAELDVCSHVDFSKPSVWSVFIGQPDFLGCSDCVLALEEASVIYNLDQCDACGKINIEIFHEYFANVGSILIHGSICGTCLKEQTKHKKESYE